MKTLQSSLKNDILKEFSLSFGTLLCSKDFCISEVVEGYHVDEEEVLELIDTLSAFYKKRKFHYINNRIAYFSVNPLCYHHFKHLETNIISTRAVLYENSQKLTSQFERNFYPLDVTFHSSLYDAVHDLNRIEI